MNCEFCNSPSTQIYEVQLGSHRSGMQRCPVCLSCQSDPLFSESQVEDFYRTQYFSRQDWQVAKAKLAAADYFKKISRKVAPLKMNRALEIGSGYGFFTKLVLEQHPDCQMDVVEPSEDCRNFMKEHLPKIHSLNLTLDAVPEQSSYDAVFCFHTVEHFQRLGSFLESLKTRVRTGGRIFILTPNAASRSFRRLGIRWGWTCSQEHFQFLSIGIPDSFYRRHGFNLVMAKDTCPATIQFPSYWMAKLQGLKFHTRRLLSESSLIARMVSHLCDACVNQLLQNKSSSKLLVIEKVWASTFRFGQKDELFLILEKM